LASSRAINFVSQFHRPKDIPSFGAVKRFHPRITANDIPVTIQLVEASGFIRPLFIFIAAPEEIGSAHEIGGRILHEPLGNG
jgi:hypothetical protein